MKKTFLNLAVVASAALSIMACKSNPAESEAHKAAVADHAKIKADHEAMLKEHAAEPKPKAKK